MKSNSPSEAKKNAKLLLEKYIKSKDYSYFKKSLELDNTNPIILFTYLDYLKNNDENMFNKEIKRYKFYLDKESCFKLNIPYIDHKNDFLEIIKAVQKVDTNTLFDLEIVKDTLNKYYPKEDKEIMEAKNEKRVNNLPLNNLDDDIIFYLSIKVEFCKHLYSLVNFDLKEDFETDYLHMAI